MKTWKILFLLFSLIMILPGAFASGGETISLRLQLFRFQGYLSADTRLDEEIIAGSKLPDPKLKQIMTFFTHGQFRLGEDQLITTDKEWTWNGAPLENGSEILSKFSLDSSVTATGNPTISVKDKNVRIKADKIEDQSQPYKEKKESALHLIAAPQILVRNRDKANIQILSNQRLEYFEKREDGFFELRESQEPTGLSIEITAQKEDKGKILLSPMTLSLRWVQKREAIPGLTLQVGKPILETTDYPMDIRITPGKFYGILLHPGDGQGILILRLKAELMQEETSKDKSSPTK